METLFINKTPTNNFIFLSLSLSLSLTHTHLRPPQSTLKLKHLQPPQNSTTSDPSRLSQDPPYISEPTIYLCSRMSSIITKSSSQHHTLLSELWIFWIDASWAGKSNWIDVGCMGKYWFFFFFWQVECVVDIFELMRGEWKNQISVIRVVILGLGV